MDKLTEEVDGEGTGQVPVEDLVRQLEYQVKTGKRPPPHLFQSLTKNGVEFIYVSFSD